MLKLVSGRFGTCVRMIYNDMFHVCVKQLSSKTSIPLLKAEAGIMRLVSCEYVPYCFGICTATKTLIMSLVTISGRATTLHSSLADQGNSVITTPNIAVQILDDVANGLNFIHAKSVLHNDLKLDNIVLGESCSRPIRAYIVDFGKACKLEDGKLYHLSPEERVVYKIDHRQIAPDLRDGIM